MKIKFYYNLNITLIKVSNYKNVNDNKVKYNIENKKICCENINKIIIKIIKKLILKKFK